jgi:hypothetical protein
MNWDEITSLWKRQQAKPLADIEHEKLDSLFTVTNRKLARRLFWTDTREILACMVVLVVFTVSALKKRDHGSWPLWTANVVILWTTFFFVRERIRAHRNKVPHDAPLLTKIGAEINMLKRRRYLAINIGYWYLGPIFAAWFLVLASTGFHGLSYKLQTPLQMWGYMLFGFFIFWGIWKRNRLAVRKRMDPRIAEMEKLRSELSSNE